MSAAADSETLLVVDDDDVFRARLARAFAERGYAVREAADGERALALAREESPELAVVDLRMPGPGGLEVVRGLHEIDPTTRIVVLTGYGSIATAVEAMRLGAVHYVAKPADADDLLAAFARAEPAEAEPGRAHPVPSLARVEWEHINRVLADCGGNVSQAARLLGSTAARSNASSRSIRFRVEVQGGRGDAATEPTLPRGSYAFVARPRPAEAVRSASARRPATCAPSLRCRTIRANTRAARRFA